MAELEIIGVPFSNFVWAVRACCEEKGVAYTLTPSRPHTPEVLAVHPFGKIPAMRHGEVTLGETRAIIGYIDAAFPGKKLLPQEPVAMAHAEQWLSLINTTLDQVMMRQFIVPLMFGKVERSAVAPAVETMKKQLAWLETQLGDGFALPMGFSAVDADLTPILNYIGMQPEGAEALAAAPKVGAYLKRMLAYPAIAKAAPPPRG
jgi:glutathione S-transferase